MSFSTLPRLPVCRRKLQLSRCSNPPSLAHTHSLSLASAEDPLRAERVPPASITPCTCRTRLIDACWSGALQGGSGVGGGGVAQLFRISNLNFFFLHQLSSLIKGIPTTRCYHQEEKNCSACWRAASPSLSAAYRISLSLPSPLPVTSALYCIQVTRELLEEAEEKNTHTHTNRPQWHSSDESKKPDQIPPSPSCSP